MRHSDQHLVPRDACEGRRPRVAGGVHRWVHSWPFLVLSLGLVGLGLVFFFFFLGGG